MKLIIIFYQHVFEQPTLNGLMGLTHLHWKETRETIRNLIDIENPVLRDNTELKRNCIVPLASVKMHLPASIGDYTDFYSSIHHATNVGIMFRLVKTIKFNVNISAHNFSCP